MGQSAVLPLGAQEDRSRMGETRVDLHHLLEDLRDAYPGAIEETILTEIVANALDSGASEIRLDTDSISATLTVVDNGSGMRRDQLRRYHDIAATTKVRGAGIGFAGVGIKLGLLVCDEVFTETRRGKVHVATSWHLLSKRRAPWRWLKPAGLVGDRGTAVRLRLRSALSPLLDRGFIEENLVRHYEALFNPGFDELLAHHYPAAVHCWVDGNVLPRSRRVAAEMAPVAIKLPRKRKPSAVGFLLRAGGTLPEGQRGVAISTFGKVIKRGWEWLGVSPTVPESVGGLIEAPALAECLTLNKADFVRAGKSGALYLAYRKAIQEVVAHQLAAWGVGQDGAQRAKRRAARPVERDLEKILISLADDFPLLASLVERRAGGQRSLPIGAVEESTGEPAPGGGPEPAGEGRDGAAVPQVESEQPTDSLPVQGKPPAGVLGTANGRCKRPARYRLRIQFEQRPGDPELSRLEQSTVWVNESHPAYRRAESSRSVGYHIALATALALSRLAVEPVREHDFVTAFLVRWGNAVDRKPRGMRRKGR
jgi:hypothetical protein